MYGVNAGVPKTLVRLLVKHCSVVTDNKELSAVLCDILDTPVSPELLPADENGNIAQKTEDLVGPYEIHDFYIYYTLRYGFSPDKLYRMAKIALGHAYSDEELLKWLKNFARRFFAQQFKRSCLPDGPKVGVVGVSPRGDLSMPSDASSAEWQKIIDTIE
jgi:NAD+ synthase (glutamine-hydrolysing)